MEKGLHVGIILDGNRRYAKKKGLQVWEGHKFGADKVSQLLDWCQELSIKEMTLYTFSIENFDRPKKEKDFLMQLFNNYLKRFSKDERIIKNKVKVNFLGRLELFPMGIRVGMKKLMDDTIDNDGNVLNFMMGYGGRAEIVDAVKKIGNKIKENEISVDDIDEKMITENLYLKTEPDLIIRPGGEIRVSNFLLWQSYYSEWYFSDKLWPEFEIDDLKKAIHDFKARERRYGK